jgi:hypothetical protein
VTLMLLGVRFNGSAGVRGLLVAAAALLALALLYRQPPLTACHAGQPAMMTILAVHVWSARRSRTK